MKSRVLGGSSLVVSEIGLGCMGLSAAYEPGSVDPADGVRVIHRAIDAGVTLLDTSNAYGPYTNEQLLGRAIADRRDEVVLATKAGCVPQTESFVPRMDGRPESLWAALDASLTRLGVDVIDLWQLHRPDPAVPIEESIGAMGEMVTAGKVRAVGACELSLEQLVAAHATHPLAVLQSELSLWTRDLLDVVLPWCREQGVAMVPFAPLGRGFLTGAIGPRARFADGDVRAVNPRFTAEALRANQAIVDRVRAVARRLGATPAQAALAWVLAQGPQVVPIPGSRTVGELDENLGAAELSLSADDLAELDALPMATGARY